MGCVNLGSPVATDGGIAALNIAAEQKQWQEDDKFVKNMLSKIFDMPNDPLSDIVLRGRVLPVAGDGSGGERRACETTGCPFHQNTTERYRLDRAHEDLPFCCLKCRYTSGKEHGQLCQGKLLAPLPNVPRTVSTDALVPGRCMR